MLDDVDLYNWEQNPLESVGWGVQGWEGQAVVFIVCPFNSILTLFSPLYYDNTYLTLCLRGELTF